ncbi:MAG: hypothetical protein NZ695_04795 [Dehalococcoidia bacterium]|jgi:hypothetical protein|nr:hypothetical protein [Dehalococcoidia bacterium]MDW8008596.1 hypothetical protein [Chloroflexota bacterium]
MTVEPILQDLARAMMAEREEEIRRLPDGVGQPRPLTAPLARLLVCLGLALDPALRRELADEAAPTALQPTLGH